LRTIANAQINDTLLRQGGTFARAREGKRQRASVRRGYAFDAKFHQIRPEQLPPKPKGGKVAHAAKGL